MTRPTSRNHDPAGWSASGHRINNWNLNRLTLSLQSRMLRAIFCLLDMPSPVTKVNGRLSSKVENNGENNRRRDLPIFRGVTFPKDLGHSCPSELSLDSIRCHTLRHEH